MAFEELKAKHSIVWGAGPYQRVTDALVEAHEHLISVCEPQPGERWLDVATGTGAIAIRAAECGADVTAQDIAPELITAATDRAAAAGVTIDFRTGDCENMPFADGEFDAVSSAFGHMFSPDHQACADELARVVKPGGRIATVTWHPTTGVAQLFAILSKYQQAPAGAGRPFDWGDTDHVNDLLGEKFDLSYARGVSVHREPSAEALWKVFVEDYGPTKVLAASLDDEQRAQLAAECIEYFESFRTPSGEVEWAREYLLTTGTRLPITTSTQELSSATA